MKSTVKIIVLNKACIWVMHCGVLHTFSFNLDNNPKRSVILLSHFTDKKKKNWLLKFEQLAQSQMANRLSQVSNSGLPCSKACALNTFSLVVLKQ